ncbi:hypothetical protein PYH37_004021 [Sinorhizobium numidicum]|uniref:Transposase n=1 Tax=Sinorhizobium numidicum TaxID=680248 RepID=A0ABY8CUX3_9HYPH|nr:hypothetical protein [Sinorhizobium numidicum]WEX79045.1 hypothetical protein PYH37_004021 [Sinorhizobium numidicum]WEX82441.1 hypothetical protein PYH38_004733 [Sinorhizobium numidicum]
MTTEARPEYDELAERRRTINAMKEAFASAIQARQAELRAQEFAGQNWRLVPAGKPS